ncbi:ABC transporter ATP-binding protein [Kitasatospora sp. NPDC057015]|uniref:ABC transporter ATP-binding protein n=1 Tax=Kitasatospora sp. NPDC057015 TaxID=3346001 RepID=UPI00362CE2FF
MTPDRLRIENLTVGHPTPGGTVRAVDGVSLAVAPGEALVLLGESGSGKTSVARAVLALPGRTARVTGRILLDGTDLRELDERALTRVRGRRIGYLPQDPTGALDPLRRIGPQLVEVLLRHRRAVGRRAARLAAVELLARAGLPEPDRIARCHPYELSGGLRQRAALALALCGDPALLVADEPTTALDALVQAQVLDLLADLRGERGLALLLVTHDLAVARRVGGAVAVMRSGRIVETGPAERVLSRPEHAFTAELVAAEPGAGR